METKEILGLAGVPVIVAMVEGCKLVFPGLSPRFYPVLALVFGLLINMGLGWRVGADPVYSLLAGVIAALAASGLYSGGKAVVSGS